MSELDFAELMDSISAEDILEYFGARYKRTTGSHGHQLNVRECPLCGGGNWKVYLNEETGLGNCFHGDCQVKFNKFKLLRSTGDEKCEDLTYAVNDYIKTYLVLDGDPSDIVKMLQ